ncbi:sodium:solute symporter family protein [bacterium]|nr:sodium:solute symporter family protein [bacterium]
MHVIGLHLLDVSVILVYIVVILWIGKKAAARNRDTETFFLAGRKLGKFYQFFLNFGCSTNADQAVGVSREIYRQGIGGMWIQFLVLFLTPFYWFSTFFFRRIRLTTIGDFFAERFRSNFLGGSYAVFIMLLSFIGGGVGYIAAGKTMMAMTPKSAEECTAAERTSIEEYGEYRDLKARLDMGLTEEETVRYDELNEKNKRGELHSFISHTDPVVFYLIYAFIVGIYTMLGGFRAAAVTDSIQGVLIILFSVILIPVGLVKIGGFSGLHASVPDYMFELFGSAALSEYAWYTIAAMAFANLVSIIAVSMGMQTAGSATNEAAARFGMIAGMFFKRFIMILWALAGLLAIGLYAGRLNDPDLIWGFMTKDLLVPGAVGLMLVGILAANMSSLDAGAVSYAALFIRNIYRPLRPDRSEKHYLFVGRIVIAVTLLGGIGVALFVDNLLELFKYIISIPAIFGASIWLGFVWRRLTKTAVLVQVVICLVIYTVLPNLFLTLEATNRHEPFLRETNPKTVTVTVSAVHADVEMGRASATGEMITKEHRAEPAGIFFEKVARIDPEDPDSPRIGLGRFHAELWIMSWFGIDFSGWSKPQLVAARFLFDGLFPFVLLFLISFFTRPVPETYLDRFYVKLYTPVQPTPELEQAALAAGYANPDRFRSQKLFPDSRWELAKPTKSDLFGFGGSWLLVGVVILTLWLMVSIK